MLLVQGRILKKKKGFSACLLALLGLEGIVYKIYICYRFPYGGLKQLGRLSNGKAIKILGSFFFVIFLLSKRVISSYVQKCTCLKLGSLPFFFFMVASNLHINLLIKLCSLLEGIYSDCLQQKFYYRRVYHERGYPLIPTCVTSN